MSSRLNWTQNYFVENQWSPIVYIIIIITCISCSSSTLNTSTKYVILVSIDRISAFADSTASITVLNCSMCLTFALICSLNFYSRQFYFSVLSKYQFRAATEDFTHFYPVAATSDFFHIFLQQRLPQQLLPIENMLTHSQLQWRQIQTQHTQTVIRRQVNIFWFHFFQKLQSIIDHFEWYILLDEICDGGRSICCPEYTQRSPSVNNMCKQQ